MTLSHAFSKDCRQRLSEDLLLCDLYSLFFSFLIMHLQASVFYISVVPSLVIKYSIPHQTFLLKFGFKYGFY